MHQVTQALWMESLVDCFSGWLGHPGKLRQFFLFPLCCLSILQCSAMGQEFLNFRSSGTQPRFFQSVGPWSSFVGLGHRWPAVLALHPLQTLSLALSRCLLHPPPHWSPQDQHCSLPSFLISSQSLTSTLSTHSRHLFWPHVSWRGCPAVLVYTHCPRDARGVTCPL